MEIKEKVKELHERVRYLANDCGGCETCLSLFKPYDHEEWKREVEKLPEEFKIQFEQY